MPEMEVRGGYFHGLLDSSLPLLDLGVFVCLKISLDLNISSIKKVIDSNKRVILKRSSITPPHMQISCKMSPIDNNP